MDDGWMKWEWAWEDPNPIMLAHLLIVLLLALRRICYWPLNPFELRKGSFKVCSRRSQSNGIKVADEQKLAIKFEWAKYIKYKLFSNAKFEGEWFDELSLTRLMSFELLDWSFDCYHSSDDDS